MSSNNILFVGNLSYDWSTEDMKSALEQLFSEYGLVSEVNVPVNFETRRHRGIAFITFETADDAASAKEQLEDKLFGPDGEEADNARELKIDFARPRKPRREFNN